MVRIQRKPRYGQRGRGSNSTNLLQWIRNALVALIAFQLFRMMSRLFASKETFTSLGDVPQGLESRLKDSAARIPKLSNLKPQNEAVPVKVQPKPLPPAKKYDHVLEDSDIHMQHPDAVKKKEASPANEQKEVEITPKEGAAVVQEGLGAPIHHIVLNKDGTGSTNVAYVHDFEKDRELQFSRRTQTEVADVRDKVATMVNELKVSPCLTRSASGLPIMNPKCLDSDTPQIVYNRAGFSRVWCGHEIPPGKAITLPERCSEEGLISHIFAMDSPPIDGKGMPPIVLQNKVDADVAPSDLENLECNIPCQRQVGMEGVESIFFQGEDWEILQTWNNSYRHAAARIERTMYRQDYYYSTQNFKSSVPLSHYSFEKFSVRNRPALDYASTQAKAVYMVDDTCEAPGSKRHKYFAAISNVYPVDSFGQCGHNAEVPPGKTISTTEGRVELMKGYRFVLVFDKVKEKDHISESIWEAFLSGSIPVVLSADNFRDHVPPNSCVNAGDYGNWDDLADDLVRISKDQTAWESYHAWRNDEEAIAKLEAKYDFTKATPECRLCRWGYAKKYGLGWNHSKQQVEENHIPRQLCTMSSSNLISKPFGEEWVARYDHDENVLSPEPDDTESCSSESSSTGVMDNDSFKIHRTVYQHEGVTDIVISKIERENSDGEIVLRMHFPGVSNTNGAHFVNTHTLVPDLTFGSWTSSASFQDDSSKVTVLTDWPTRIECPMEGYIEVIIQAPEENVLENAWHQRVRVISEDMNEIHDKMTEFFPSSFGKRMTKDFVDTLELFYADL